MSTKTERASRAQHFILPMKFQVRQTDGSYITQVVDANVRRREPKDRTPPIEIEE